MFESKSIFISLCSTSDMYWDDMLKEWSPSPMTKKKSKNMFIKMKFNSYLRFIYIYIHTFKITIFKLNAKHRHLVMKKKQ